LRVTVLGCGPAGLIAAHSAISLGAEVRILSKKEKSFIGGAQYLHEPIPGISSLYPDGEIKIEMWGDEKGYALKVYGDPNHQTSWKNYHHGEHRPAWDLRKTYDVLWERYEHLVTDIMITEELLKEQVAKSTDFIISSIPAKGLCTKIGAGHHFHKRKVLISQESAADEDNLIIWNGEADLPWSRWSRIFGVNGGYEYPLGSIVAGARAISKPLSTNCNCYPGMLRVGRYGRWNKEGLTHEAFSMTRRALEDRSALL
jgi:hypothetical protein